MGNTQADYDSLRRLHDSTNVAVEELQAENVRLKTKITLLSTKLINCQKALDINKTIMQNALIEQNRMQTEYGQEIQELKTKIKELED